MTAPLTGRLNVAVLAGCDPTSRDLVAGGLLLDGARTALLAYDQRRDADGRLSLERRVVDSSGTIYVDLIDGDEDCACCRLRDDLPGALDVVATSGRWDRLLLAPPLAAPVHDVAAQLRELSADDPSLRLCSVMAAIEGSTIIDDLFGDDLLDERGAALSPADRRSVGEAVIEQIDYADLVVGAGTTTGPSAAVIDQLAGDRWRTDWTRIDPGEVFDARHDVERARRRMDPLHAAPGPRSRYPHPDVWTLDLHSPRPLHPGRLMERLEDLGTGRIRARGYVWLPSRPDVPCAWDASGGQLSIGSLPSWGAITPATRIVVTGVGAAERQRIAAAFDDVVCRPGETADPAGWTSRPDGFEPWLGRAS